MEMWIKRRTHKKIRKNIIITVEKRMNHFKTLNEFLIVEHVDHRKVSKGGIYMETSSKNPGVPASSNVVYCTENNDNGLSEGDEIIFYRHAAEDIYVADKKYLIISGKSVIGVFVNENEKDGNGEPKSKKTDFHNPVAG